MCCISFSIRISAMSGFSTATAGMSVATQRVRAPPLGVEALTGFTVGARGPPLWIPVGFNATREHDHCIQISVCLFISEQNALPSSDHPSNCVVVEDDLDMLFWVGGCEKTINIFAVFVKFFLLVGKNEFSHLGHLGPGWSPFAGWPDFLWAFGADSIDGKTYDIANVLWSRLNNVQVGKHVV